MKKNAVILNYGIGNFSSLIGAFKNLNYDVKVSVLKTDLEKSDLIILPGVGTFPEAMKNLKKLKLDKLLRKLSKKRKKILGICLGMQLLTDSSDELVFTKGLKIIEGKFEYLKQHNIGWSKLSYVKNKNVKGMKCEDYFFFQHNLSYIGPKKNIDAYTQGFKKIPSILRKNNTIGVQFHPEKSQHAGYNYLENLFDE
jgi:imidazole glycerol-phosphate synthase subunit HisH